LPLPPGLLALSTTPIAVKNVRICGDLGCEYFRRMAAIGGGGATGLYANTIGTMTIAMAAAPFTGGLSLAVVAG
jgi:hypothetical protein